MKEVVSKICLNDFEFSATCNKSIVLSELSKHFKLLTQSTTYEDKKSVDGQWIVENTHTFFQPNELTKGQQLNMPKYWLNSAKIVNNATLLENKPGKFSFYLC